MQNHAHLINTKKVSLLTRCKRSWLLLCWLCQQLRIFGKKYDRDNNPNKRIKQKQAADAILKALNIQVQVHGLEHFAKQKSLIVSNHASWMDVFVLLSISPMSFIAKQEISKWPLIGRIVRNGGTVFINRNNRKDSAKINHIITEHLQQNAAVAFFPEAGIADGKNIQPFKAALFQSALDSDALTQPVTINYMNQDNSHNDAAIYDDSVNLLQSLWRVISTDGMLIQIYISKPLVSKNYASRFELKDAAQAAIASHFIARSFQK